MNHRDLGRREKVTSTAVFRVEGEAERTRESGLDREREREREREKGVRD